MWVFHNAIFTSTGNGWNPGRTGFGVPRQKPLGLRNPPVGGGSWLKVYGTIIIDLYLFSWVYVGFNVGFNVGFMLGLRLVYVGFMLGLCWVYVEFISL